MNFLKKVLLTTLKMMLMVFALMVLWDVLRNVACVADCPGFLSVRLFFSDLPLWLMVGFAISLLKELAIRAIEKWRTKLS